MQALSQLSYGPITTRPGWDPARAASLAYFMGTGKRGIAKKAQALPAALRRAYAVTGHRSPFQGLDMTDLVIRSAAPADIPAILSIYAPAVRDGLASFEYEPPDEAEMARRHAAIVGGGYPYLVAMRGSDIVGYAYASAYRTRPGYRFTVENSVYVRPGVGRGGIGRALVMRLIADCTAGGYRQMVAVIGDLGNAASIGLHRACGFTVVGVLPAIGWKHGRWVDSVLMQRALGEGDGAPAD